MGVLTSALLLTLVIFAGREAHSHKGCAAEQKESWSYSGDNGPRHWWKRYLDCNGTNQSPIDIDTNEVVPDDNLAHFEMVNYEVPVSSANITNNGHTIQVTPTDGVPRSIQNGSLPTGYNLTQLHFHWASRSSRGSEHRINGKRFAMEMHLVHVNNQSKIAVVGVFFEETYKNNPKLAPIMKALNYTRYKGEQTTMKSPLNLAHLIPNRKNFYRYFGSLTTPGCAEGVIWTLFAEPMSCGAAQMQVFRSLNSTRRSEEQHCRMENNYRNVQLMRGRLVTSVREDW